MHSAAQVRILGRTRTRGCSAWHLASERVWMSIFIPSRVPPRRRDGDAIRTKWTVRAVAGGRPKQQNRRSTVVSTCGLMVRRQGIELRTRWLRGRSGGCRSMSPAHIYAGRNRVVVSWCTGGGRVGSPPRSIRRAAMCSVMSLQLCQYGPADPGERRRLPSLLVRMLSSSRSISLRNNANRLRDVPADFPCGPHGVPAARSSTVLLRLGRRS